MCPFHWIISWNTWYRYDLFLVLLTLITQWCLPSFFTATLIFPPFYILCFRNKSLSLAHIQRGGIKLPFPSGGISKILGTYLKTSTVNNTYFEGDTLRLCYVSLLIVIFYFPVSSTFNIWNSSVRKICICLFIHSLIDIHIDSGYLFYSITQCYHYFLIFIYIFCWLCNF